MPNITLDGNYFNYGSSKKYFRNVKCTFSNDKLYFTDNNTDEVLFYNKLFSITVGVNIFDIDDFSGNIPNFINAIEAITLGGVTSGGGGATGADGADGADGDSAYQIWLNNGNTGSETDFLNSLDGDDGNGIISIVLHATNGLVKTYRITLTDNTTFDYDVTDGVDGQDAPNLKKRQDHWRGTVRFKDFHSWVTIGDDFGLGGINCSQNVVTGSPDSASASYADPLVTSKAKVASFFIHENKYLKSIIIKGQNGVNGNCNYWFAVSKRTHIFSINGLNKVGSLPVNSVIYQDDSANLMNGINQFFYSEKTVSAAQLNKGDQLFILFNTTYNNEEGGDSLQLNNVEVFLEYTDVDPSQ